MIITKAAKRNIILFIAAFLLCGIFRNVLYAKDFAFSFSSFFCALLTLLWALSIQRRVIDRRLRTLLIWIATFLMLHFVLQIARYDILWAYKSVQRYIWYAYYIPLTAQPLLLFFLAVSIYRPEDRPLPRRYYPLIAVGALLVLGVLTNDLHFWFKSFPSGIMDDNGQEKNGWLYYAVNVFSYGLYALAFFIIIRKNHRYVSKQYRWLPFVPFLIGILYFALFPLDIGHHFFRTRIWQMGEMTGFCIISALEACIQTGMIPANMGYETIFSASRFPAVIMDYQGIRVYQTAALQDTSLPGEDVELVRHPISGGSIEYAVDMKRIHYLNRELEEGAQRIEARNAYLNEENRIKKERAEVENRNRLYERITGLVLPQIERIEELLQGECGNGQLARIAVLEAYIKRRSNMELLATGGRLTVVELASAVAESLDYLKLCGVNTVSSAVGTGSYPSGMVIAAYELFETVIERSMDTLSDLAVTVRSGKQVITVRLMLKAEDFSLEESALQRAGEGFSCRVDMTKEERDAILVLSFTEGGVVG